jgi:Methyltransferase domain
VQIAAYERVRAQTLKLRKAVRTGRSSSRDVLLARLPKGGVCAEVGTWKGDFAARILGSTKPSRLYLIDPWEYRGESEYEHAMYGGHQPGGHQGMEAIYKSVLDRFSAEIDCGQVVPLRMRSMDAVARFTDVALDWVYIDSDHRYESVRSDLEMFYRVVRPGGLIAGDDYGQAGWWEDGVTKAVDEFASSGRCAPPTILDSQFLFTKF